MEFLFMTKVLKLKIVKPTQLDWNTLGSILSNLDYHGHKIKNEAMSRYYELWRKELEYNAANPDDKFNAAKRKEVYGYSQYNSVIYNEIKTNFEELGFHSEVIPGLIKSSVEAHGKVAKDMLRGEAVLPTFKRGQPIPIRSRQIKMTSPNTMTLSLINKIGGERYGVQGKGRSFPIEVAVASKAGYVKGILRKLFDGEYDICDSNIVKDGKDIYILLVYKTNTVKQAAIDPSKILGVDLGVSKAAYMAVDGALTNRWIDGGEIESFRRRIEARRKSIRNQMRVASDNRRGHGRKTLLKPLDTLSSKVENFKDTTNHRYSKAIVDYAIKNGCGTIQMEDLSGIRKASNFLSTWSYYDLQQKTKYKAEEYGIKFKLINPKYTSQRCHKCGVIDKESRKDQKTFKCTTCGHSANADWNAARNIAMDGIESIIKAQCKSQGLPI